ncbi:MAG: alpha/beta hydrolase [Gammaproteobacteria bacterium]|jgi:pimeloyl-ACP methyl ester carboxylesterase
MASRKEMLRGGRPSERPMPIGLRLMRAAFAGLGPVLPGLLGRWACHLWFQTRRFPESAAGRQAIRSARRETLTVDGIPVAVYRWGETGPVVVFIHGWSGRGSQVAAFIEPLQAAGFRVLSLDAPGHGNTPGDRTNILECVRVLQACEQHYGPFHSAITHSFGGMVLALALARGMPVGRAVCFSTPADAGFLLDSFASTLAMPKAVVVNLNKRLERRFDGNFRERLSTVNNVRRLSVPALIIHDAGDTGVPWWHGEQIAAAWPGARFLKTRGLGHGRILRDPATVRAAVEFLGAG